MLKTVIFDMDGVIVDTEPVHHFAYYQLFNQLNIEVSEELYASFTGNSTKNVMQKLINQFYLTDSVETLIKIKRNLFNDAFDIKADLFLIEGVLPLIESFHQQNIQLILASSSSKVTINRVFKRFNLHQYFTHIVSGEDFPKSKPHPAIFIEAARISDTSVKNCIVIEDSTNGILAANAANIFCVGYKSKNSKNQNYSTANMVINHFNELNFNKLNKIYPTASL